MNKRLAIILCIAAICFSGCDRAKTEYKPGKKITLKSVSDTYKKDMESCKKKDYENLDFDQCGVKCPEMDRCAGLEVDLSAIQGKSGKELYETFVAYCQFYFKDFDAAYVLFSSPKAEELYQKEKASHPKNLNDEKYTWYPRYQEYKAQIENGELQVLSFLYRNIEKNQYLWWVVDSGSFPSWVNKGEAYASFQTEETKVSSWMPTDIPKNRREKSFINDGTYDGERYSLAGEEISIGEAVSYFEKDYLSGLPYEIGDEYSISVSKVDVVKIGKGNYAYVFSYSSAWRRIPYDRSDEIYSDKDISKYFTSSGEAIMIKKGDIDAITGFSFPAVKEKEQIDKVYSLKDAVGIVNDKLTHGVKFELRVIEFVYQGEYSKDFTKATLVPVWKFTVFNPNDNLFHCIYINAFNGEYHSYSYTLIGE